MKARGVARLGLRPPAPRRIMRPAGGAAAPGPVVSNEVVTRPGRHVSECVASAAARRYQRWEAFASAGPSSQQRWRMSPDQIQKPAIITWGPYSEHNASGPRRSLSAGG